MPDAVVVGAGPNGMVAANTLADAGWDVVVLEAAPTPGGAVRTEELTVPGFRHDVFSAFYPLAVGSPVLMSLDLGDHGLRWSRAPAVLAHPFADGRTAVLSQEVDETAASVDAFAPGDGDAWRRLYDEWLRIGPAMIDALMRPFPPVWPALRLAAKLRTPRNLLGFVRTQLLPVRRMGEERFTGEGAAILLAGNTLHSDLSPESAIGATYGWLLSMLGQQHGFPVPEGGAGELITALVRRLESKGGRVVCDAPVAAVVVRAGRAVAVRTADGREVDARKAVLADVLAPTLYRDLVGYEHLPSGFVDDLLRTFQLDNGTVKVDWALSGPIPWKDPAVGRAGTVHVGDDLDQLTEFAAHLAMGRIPRRPFLLAGQMTTADATRSPAGTETAWAYTHVPPRVKGDLGATDGERELTGAWDADETARMADRIEEQIEALAPGFRDRIVGRHVLTPPAMEAKNPNLLGGAINGGTAQLHQQLVFRPGVGAWGRPETPVKGLYLASSSAHPGGGVHGACGSNAAAAALLHDRIARALRRG